VATFLMWFSTVFIFSSTIPFDCWCRVVVRLLLAGVATPAACGETRGSGHGSPEALAILRSRGRRLLGRLVEAVVDLWSLGTVVRSDH
jgi:hypothetical protein